MVDIYEVGGKAADALERYGVGIPFALASVGVVIAVVGANGVVGWYSMSVYGQFGVAVLGVSSALFIGSAGFLYANIDKRWWLKTEEEDAQTPVEMGDPDDG